MLYKKISSFFQDENSSEKKDKKNIQKNELPTNKIKISTKCESNLHRHFTQQLTKLSKMNEEINNAKTLKLISLLP